MRSPRIVPRSPSCHPTALGVSPALPSPDGSSSGASSATVPGPGPAPAPSSIIGPSKVVEVKRAGGQRKHPGIRVLKLGGTSMADAVAVENLAVDLAAHGALPGTPLETSSAARAPAIVVVSALAGVTDGLAALLSGDEDPAPALGELRYRLSDLVGRVSAAAPARRARITLEARLTRLANDLEILHRTSGRLALAHGSAESVGLSPAALQVRILAAGEKLASPILRAALETAGLSVGEMDPTQILRAQGPLLDAEPDLVASRRRVLFGWRHWDLREPGVWVVPGFVVGGEDGRERLLGRGGSDSSATLLAAALGAERLAGAVEIWTDVDGVYPVDPKRDPTARPFAHLAFEQAQELVTNGAKVLHTKSLWPARQAGIDIRVRNSRNLGLPGTWIGDEGRARARQASMRLDRPTVPRPAVPEIGPLHGEESDLAWARRWLPALCAIDTSRGREGRIRPRLERLLTELGARITVQAIPSSRKAAGALGEPVDAGGMPRANVLATWGRPRVLFTTHLDTVSPHLPVRPWTGEKGEIGLRARGACDALGQAVAQLAAIRRLLRTGSSDLAWLGVVGEETSADGAAAALRLPGLGGVRAVINGEPTGNHLASGQMGYQHLRLTCSGKRSHGGDVTASHPETGSNALWHLHTWLAAARGLPLKRHAVFGQESWNLGQIRGGEAANVVAGEALAEITVRTVPGSTFSEGLAGLARGGSAAMSSAMSSAHSAAASADGRRERQGAFDREVEVVVDEGPCELDTVPGWPSSPVAFGSDAPMLRPLCHGGKLLMVGPGSILDAHTDHERLSWAELESGIDLLEGLCLELRDPELGSPEVGP